MGRPADRRLHGVAAALGPGRDRAEIKLAEFALADLPEDDADHAEFGRMEIPFDGGWPRQPMAGGIAPPGGELGRRALSAGQASPRIRTSVGDALPRGAAVSASSGCASVEPGRALPSAASRSDAKAPSGVMQPLADPALVLARCRAAAAATRVCRAWTAWKTSSACSSGSGYQPSPEIVSAARRRWSRTSKGVALMDHRPLPQTRRQERPGREPRRVSRQAGYRRQGRGRENARTGRGICHVPCRSSGKGNPLARTASDT